MGLKTFRLLPRDSPLGWTPYAWLLYLPTFLIEPIVRTQEGRASALYWVVTIAGLVAFLAAYFRGYWLRGVKLLRVALFITALAVAFSFVNVGASVFFVYAAAFAGNLDRPALGLRVIVLIAAAGMLTALLVQPPFFFWLTGVVITLMVGGVNLHFAQDARSQRSLRLAQEQVQHLAAVAERERIARDLHDVLGHTLSLIVLKSELASRLAESDPARAAGEMRDVEDVARRTLQDVREAIRGYRATLHDEARRAEAMLETAGIDADVAIVADELPSHVEEALALALREAVTNVVRHSGAARCTVRLTASERDVQLAVTDDGRGAGSAEGTGLRGMRERVEAFGGSVRRQSHGGTTLVVTMPLRAARVHEPLAGTIA